MSAYVSPSTGEEPYSGTFKDIKDVLRVLNIGEGKMAVVTQEMVASYQEMIDRDIDALLQDVYQTPIRSYNMIQAISSGGSPAIPGGMAAGTKEITVGSLSVTLTLAGWSFTPTSIIATVTMPAGGDNIFATVDNSTITANGFTANLSSAPTMAGYFMDYIAIATAVNGVPYVGSGAQVRVFPGDVRRAARYWTAGQILVNEFQQLEANLTEQATQMIVDARMQVYAMSRMNHRIPGQRRKSTISKTLPAGLQPNAFPERPS